MTARVRTERARDLRLTDSRAEQAVWELLRAHRMGGLKFRRQRFSASEAVQNPEGVWAEIARFGHREMTHLS